jgi:outer membrane murein-binding lipoprotein Lpp
MSDNVENIVLEHLRHIRSKVDQIADDMSDLKHRMSSLESAMVSVKHEVAHGDETDARQQVTLDKLVERIQRIENRLELIG